MVLINKAINEVTLKLVYYGPGLCGKTTNLEQIYANPRLDNKGKMISMSTETDRTLFFDFMPMELGTIAGQKVRVQLYTVPGQVFYDATRKLVLRGADGVVFVADSQPSMRESNIESLENLRENLRLNRLDPDRIAMVFQYNKRDLPDVSPVGEMNGYLSPGEIPVVEAAALKGLGVTQTLRAAVGRMLDNLKNNVDVTLYENTPMPRPVMKAGSGAPASSAGISRINVAASAQARDRADRGEAISMMPPPTGPDHSPEASDALFASPAPAQTAAVEVSFDEIDFNPAGEMEEAGSIDAAPFFEPPFAGNEQEPVTEIDYTTAEPLAEVTEFLIQEQAIDFASGAALQQEEVEAPFSSGFAESALQLDQSDGSAPEPFGDFAAASEPMISTLDADEAPFEPEPLGDPETPLAPAAAIDTRLLLSAADELVGSLEAALEAARQHREQLRAQLQQ
jgi:mutual gliding-motility protein MglA